MHRHDGPRTHEHDGAACCGPEASAAPALTFRAGRAYKVRGLECAEEVAVLKQAVGPIRRDCLDHVVVFGEQHLRHLLNSYQRYYNEVRTHLSLKKDAPLRRDVRRVGRVLPLPILGGLHHQYVRV